MKKGKRPLSLQRVHPAKPPDRLLVQDNGLLPFFTQFILIGEVRQDVAQLLSEFCEIVILHWIVFPLTGYILD